MNLQVGKLEMTPTGEFYFLDAHEVNLMVFAYLNFLAPLRAGGSSSQKG